MSDAGETIVREIQSYIDGLIASLPNFGIALLAFLLFLLGSWAAKRAVTGLLRRRDRSNLGLLLGGFTKWTIILFGLLVVATIVFPSVKPADVLATMGIGSVAIGFAFKDILQNWLSGVLILYRQPFRVGDEIKSGEFEGAVERIEARATSIRTYDGQRVVIPNNDIYSRAVVVRTAFPQRRSEYDVGIGYGDDIDRACDIIRATLANLPDVEKKPEPDAFPCALDAFTVNIKVRWWSKANRSSVVRAQGVVIAAVKHALIDAGIDLPYPTNVVLFHDQTEETDGDRTRQREGWPAGNDPPRPRRRTDNVADVRTVGESGARPTPTERESSAGRTRSSS